MKQIAWTAKCRWWSLAKDDGRITLWVCYRKPGNNPPPCVGVSVGIKQEFTLMEARIRKEQAGLFKQLNVNVPLASVGQNMIDHTMKVTKWLWDLSSEFSLLENHKRIFVPLWVFIFICVNTVYRFKYCIWYCCNKFNGHGGLQAYQGSRIGS